MISQCFPVTSSYDRVVYPMSDLCSDSSPPIEIHPENRRSQLNMLEGLIPVDGCAGLCQGIRPRDGSFADESVRT